MAFLTDAGADRDEAGRAIIYGEPIVSGLDPSEVVVPAGTRYSVHGEHKPLAADLAVTGFGCSPIVI